MAEDQKRFVFLPGVEGVQHLKMSDLLLLKDAGFGDANLIASVRRLNRVYYNHLANTNEKEWPPIEVVHVQDTTQIKPNYGVMDMFVIIDGMHRYHAALKKRMFTIAAHMGSYANENEVVLAYLLANTKHGQPANDEARRAAAWMMYQKDYTLSPEDIAPLTGLSILQVSHSIENILMANQSELDEAPENETPEQREVRLFCGALQRFFTNQQDKLRRFVDASENEKEVGLIANELHEHYNSLKPRQQVQLAEALHAFIDIMEFISANKLV